MLGSRLAAGRRSGGVVGGALALALVLAAPAYGQGEQADAAPAEESRAAEPPWLHPIERPLGTPAPLPPELKEQKRPKEPLKPRESVDQAGVEETQRPDPMVLLERSDFPGSVPLFGSDFRFAVGGYVKLDALVDFAGNGNRYAFSLSQIPVEGADTQPSGYFSMHPFESRLNVDVRYFGEKSPANQAFIEIDFFTTAPERLGMPRLRHAYLKWGPVLAGHTSAILTDLRPLPFIIDFAFADSVNAVRVPQVRYEDKVLPFLVVRAGIEMPERSGVDNPSELPGAASPRFPRAAANVSFEGDQAFLSFGSSVGEIRWDAEGNGPNASVLSWAITANARAFLDQARHSFIGTHGSIGQGSAETVGAFVGQDVNATLLSDGALEAIPTFHGVIGYAHRFIEVVSTNFAFAFDALARRTKPDEDEMRSAWSFHANVIIHVSKPLSTGVEYMMGERRNESGAVGRDQRVQAMLMYKF